MCTHLPFHRVVRVDDEENIVISVPGFISEWKSKGKNTLKPLKVDMQFLETHQNQYLELHADLIKIDYSPQSEAALTNFKILLLL